MVVLVEYRVALRLAHLLEDDLLGHLRCDTSERRRVFIEAKFSTDLNLGRKFAGLIERHLVDVVLKLIGSFHYRLVDIGANLARLAVHLGAHILLRLVVLAGGQRDGVLNGAYHYLRLDSLIPA